MRIPVILLFIGLCICYAWCAVSSDEVKSLPGFKGKVDFKHYSGYLQGEGGKHLHYWFFEAAKEPSKAPIVLWLNGGPGCSSMEGALSENGPFRIQSDGKTLEENKYSWNLVANVLYMESPVGVGFSYSDDKNYRTDDDIVSLANYNALLDFFKKYPEYDNNDFFITGESYGGIYVPTLSERVIDGKKLKNFKGFAVGNGLSNNDLNDNSIIFFAFYHGLVSLKTWDAMIKACCNGCATNCDFTHGKSKECSDLVNSVSAIVGQPGIDIYNLYSKCAGGVGQRLKANGHMYYTNPGWLFANTLNVQVERKQLLYHPLNMTHMQLPCVDTTPITTYMNNMALRKALHIPEGLPKWELCSALINLSYKRVYSTMIKQYQKALDAKLRILVYNGDFDMACNFLGDEWFVASLKQKELIEKRAWYYFAEDGTKQIAGFARQFEHITFLTVKGAGHMVPEDKPNPAFVMFNKFIKGENY